MHHYLTEKLTVKMKNISLFMIFTCLCALVFAQPTTDYTANQAAKKLYDEALTQARCTPLRRELLEKATALQTKIAFEVSHLTTKAELVIELECGKIIIDTSAVDKIIELAVKNMADDKTRLANTLVQLTQQTRQVAPQQALRYAEAALVFLENPSEDYFNFLIDDFVPLIYGLELEFNLEKYVTEAKKALEMAKDKKPQLWTLYYALETYYHTAIQAHEQTIITAKKALAENERYNILSTNQIGDLYVRISTSYALTQNKLESEQWLQRYAAHFLPDTLSYYDAYTYFHQLALMKAEMQDLAGSVVFFEQALAKIEPYAADYQDDVKLLYNNLSQLYFYLKNDTATKKYIDKVFEYGYDVAYSTIYNEVLRRLNDYKNGLKHTKTALHHSIKNFNPTSIYENPTAEAETQNPQRVAALLSQKVVFLTETGIKNKDAELLKMSIPTGELSLAFAQKTDVGGLYESGQYARKRYLYQPTIDWLLYSAVRLYELAPTQDNMTQIFNYMEKAQSRTLAQVLTPLHLPDTLISQKDNLMQTAQQLQQKIAFSTKAETIKTCELQLYETNAKLETLMRHIKQKYPTAFTITDNNFIALPELSKNIDAQTVLIYIIRYVDSYFLFAVTHEKQFFVRKIEDAAAQNALKDLPTLLKSPFLAQEENTAKFIDASAILYQTFIEPLENALINKTKIIFITNEELAHLPLEVLLPTNEKKPFHELDFLIKKFDISYQYSGTIYHRLKQKAPILDKSLLAFAPVFEDNKAQATAMRSIAAISDTTQQGTRSDNFVQLPKSETEIKEIDKIVQQNGGVTTTLLKKQASKDKLQNELQKKSYQFVHLATHGIVNLKDPRLSGLVCYETDTDIQKNILFGGEVQYFDIAANLVVLSSCESGIGRVERGEGLLALNRSFIYSGARNVLFSLWKVNDAYTSDLMINFYDFYFKNNTHATALRAAKLKMLQAPTTALPTYWAAFVLIGE